MKKLLLLIILILANTMYCQFVNYKYNMHILYKLGEEGELHSILYNNKEYAPIMNKQYTPDQNFTDNDDVNFSYSFKGKTQIVNGKMYNQKDVIIRGISSSEINFQAKNLEKTTDLYTVHNFSCNEYKKEIEDTKSYIVLYTTNLKDGVDYNAQMKEVEKLVSVEIPVLEKGEIVISIGMNMSNGNYWEMIKYIKSESIKQEMTLSQKNLTELYELMLLDIEIPKPSQFPSPSYCTVIGFDENTDELVKEKTEYFLNDMCYYFEEFGKYNNQSFCQFFDNEIERQSKHLAKYEILDTKQILKYRNELLKYSKTNLKENLF